MLHLQSHCIVDDIAHFIARCTAHEVRHEVVGRLMKRL